MSQFGQISEDALRLRRQANTEATTTPQLQHPSIVWPHRLRRLHELLDLLEVVVEPAEQTSCVCTLKCTYVLHRHRTDIRPEIGQTLALSGSGRDHKTMTLT